MRTSAALPWPTSASVTSIWPSPGRDCGGSKSAAISGSASARSRHGSGEISNTAPSRPAACAHAGAAPAVQTAPSVAASQPKHTIRACTSQAPACHSGGASMPSKASGVISSVTSGIATRLATNSTSDDC